VVTQIQNNVTEDVAFAVTRRGVITLWNAAAEKILGYSASTAIGQHCWKLLCGQDVYGNPYCSEHCTLREMAFRHDSVNNYQACFKTDSEGRKRFSISCLLVFSKAGNDLLLHICHPKTEAIRSGNSDTGIRSRAGQKVNTLTRREKEVLNFLTEGKSTRQIASIMCVSTPTVRNHVQHVLNKLNVHSRFEAIMLGKRLSRI